jgi:hypothetical protein
MLETPTGASAFESVLYNSRIYHIEAKSGRYAIWSLDGPELNFLQHRYYRENIYHSWTKVPLYPGQSVSIIFIASILCSRESALSGPSSLSGLHRSLASHLPKQKSLSFPNINSNLSKPSSIDPPKISTLAKV